MIFPKPDHHGSHNAQNVVNALMVMFGIYMERITMFVLWEIMQCVALKLHVHYASTRSICEYSESSSGFERFKFKLVMSSNCVRSPNGNGPESTPNPTSILQSNQSCMNLHARTIPQTNRMPHSPLLGDHRRMPCAVMKHLHR